MASRLAARRQDELRKRARRYSEFTEAALQQAVERGSGGPPASAQVLSRVAQQNEEVRRAYAAAHYDVRALHQGIGNDAVRSSLHPEDSAYREQDARRHAAMAHELLARDEAWDGGWDEGGGVAGDFGDALGGEVATHVTMRDQAAGLDVTYDLSGGAPDVNLKQVHEGLGSGQPLDGETKAYMEWRFGVDFGKVRIHTGPKADAISKALFAHAFALGEHVAFQADAYRPGTASGDRLLAHELMHVVQSGNAPVKDQSITPVAARSADPAAHKSASVSEPTDSFEVEADAVADRVVKVGRSEFARVRREARSGDEETARKAALMYAPVLGAPPEIEATVRAPEGSGSEGRGADFGETGDFGPAELTFDGPGAVEADAGFGAVEADAGFGAAEADAGFGAAEADAGFGAAEADGVELESPAAGEQAHEAALEGLGDVAPLLSEGPDGVARFGVGELFDSLTQEFQNAVADAEAAVSGLPGVQDAMNAAKGAVSAAKGAANKAKDAAKGAANQAKDAAQGAQDEAKGWLSGAMDKVSSIFSWKDEDGPELSRERRLLAAEAGLKTGAGRLPHLERIQEAFGRYDVSSVAAHTGSTAKAAADAAGAAAYAAGEDVVLGTGTDLHTVAHEAAHVVQQRAGVQLDSGLGKAGDGYEQHADAVADAVVRGQSAEPLLDAFVGQSVAQSAAVSVSHASGVQLQEGGADQQAEEIKFSLNLGNKKQQITIPKAKAGGTTYTEAISGISGLEDPVTVHLDLANNKVTGGQLRGTLTAKELTGGVTFQIQAGGTTGTVTGKKTVPWNCRRFGKGEVELELKNGAIIGNADVATDNLFNPGDELSNIAGSGKLMVSGLGKVSATFSGTAALAGGQLPGDLKLSYRNGEAGGTLDAKIEVPSFKKAFENGQKAGKGLAEPPKLKCVFQDGKWKGEDEVTYPGSAPGVEGESKVQLKYEKGKFSGGGDGTFAIADFIKGTVATTVAASGAVTGTFTADTASFSLGPITCERIRLKGGLKEGDISAKISGSLSAFDGKAKGNFSSDLVQSNGMTWHGDLTVKLPKMKDTKIGIDYTVGQGFSGSGSIVPKIKGLDGSVDMKFTGTDFEADGKLTIDLPIVKNGTLAVKYQEGKVTGEADIGVDAFDIGGGITVTSSTIKAKLDDDFTISGFAGVSMAGGMVKGEMDLSFDGSKLTGSIASTFNPPGINPVTLTLAYKNGEFSGSASTQIDIPFVKSTALEVLYKSKQFGGRAKAELEVPFLKGGSVEVEIDPDGNVGGKITVKPKDLSIPPLKVTNTEISGEIMKGKVSLSGKGTVTGIPGVESAELAMSVTNGTEFTGSVAGKFKIPGTKEAEAKLTLNSDGSVSGEAKIEADFKGATGAVTAKYDEGKWSGEGTIGYKKGKFDGSITAKISEGGNISGKGRVSYKLSEKFKVTTDIELREDQTMKIGGAIEAPSEVPLFEKDWKKTIFEMTGRFGIPGLSVQLPVVGVIGLEARLSGKLEAFAKLKLAFTDIKAEGSFDTATDAVELQIGGMLKGSAEAGVSATARLSVGLGIGPAFIGGYIQIKGTAKAEVGVGAGVSAHYNSGQGNLGFEIKLNANAGLAFELELSGGIEASVDLWLKKWSHDWPIASKTWTYRPGINFNYNPQFNYEVGKLPSAADLKPSSTPQIDGNALAKKAGSQAKL